MASKFELKNAANDQFMFNLKAGNGETILTSEMYKSKASAKNGIDSVKENSQDRDMFEEKESSKGSPYFVLKAKNGQIIGASEMYSSVSGMRNGIDSVMKNAPGADVVDLTE
jgi:uncharacterized protein